MSIKCLKRCKKDKIENYYLKFQRWASQRFFQVKSSQVLERKFQVKSSQVIRENFEVSSQVKSSEKDPKSSQVESDLT